jgi:hypothetical protein
VASSVISMRKGNAKPAKPYFWDIAWIYFKASPPPGNPSLVLDFSNLSFVGCLLSFFLRSSATAASNHPPNVDYSRLRVKARMCHCVNLNRLPRGGQCQKPVAIRRMEACDRVTDDHLRQTRFMGLHHDGEEEEFPLRSHEGERTAEGSENRIVSSFHGFSAEVKFNGVRP